MITINDVAKLAGVSNATASRALSKKGKIKPSTMEKVHVAAKELGYVVNTTAQALKTSCRNKVGLIVSDANNDYYHYIQSSIQELLKKLNYELTISFSSENPVDERKSFQTLIGLGAAFIFFTPTCSTNKEIIEIALKNNIHVIQLFRKIYPDLPSIINDDEGGSYKATKYLISKKKKNLLLFDVDYEYLDFSIVTPNRSIGFSKAIKEEKAIGNIIRLKLTSYKTSAFKDAIDKFSPDAIIAANGDFGYDIYKMLKDSKNNKIELVTYDDNRWFNLLKIITIKQNLKSLSEAISLIIKNNDSQDVSLVINEELQTY